LVIVGYAISVHGSTFGVLAAMYEWTEDEESIIPLYRVDLWQVVPVGITFGTAFIVSFFTKYVVQLKRVTSRL